MTTQEAVQLLGKLRGMGVQLRLNAEGVMQYRDCDGALSDTQDAHLQRHRVQLTAALDRELRRHEERIEEHLPVGMIRPCFGLRFRCLHFSKEEMLTRSASEFAAHVGKRRDVCGDCTLFHAQYELAQSEYELAQSEEERKKKAARQEAKERTEEMLRRRYFDAEEQPTE